MSNKLLLVILLFVLAGAGGYYFYAGENASLPNVISGLSSTPAAGEAQYREQTALIPEIIIPLEHGGKTQNVVINAVVITNGDAASIVTDARISQIKTIIKEAASSQVDTFLDPEVRVIARRVPVPGAGMNEDLSNSLRSIFAEGEIQDIIVMKLGVIEE